MRLFTKIILILLNTILCVALILGCYGSKINEGDYWFLGLFTLITPYLIFFTFTFIVFWIFAKRVFTLLGIITFIICWKPILQVIQFRAESFEYKNKDARAIRVMSWNVELFAILESRTHPEMKKQMMDLINQTDPDIACFQEMVAGESRERSINYLPDIYRVLKMPYHYYAYDNKHNFDKWHHFGKMILSKFPIINAQTICSDTSNYNSCFEFADIIKDKDTFRVFNIHLQTLRFSKNNKRYIDDPTLKRDDGLSEPKSILEKIKKSDIKRHHQADKVKKEIEKSPYPVMLCGDFNDVPNSYAYTQIGNGLINAFVEKGSGIGNTFSDLAPTLRIDNIFSDPRFHVNQYIRIKKKLSDHYPIVADLVY